MEELINFQYMLFSGILNRELTIDEKYLIKNSFQNGFENGEQNYKNRLLNGIEKKLF